MLEVKIGLTLVGRDTFETKGRSMNSPSAGGQFLYSEAVVRKRFVAKGWLKLAIWDDHRPERPIAWCDLGRFSRKFLRPVLPAHRARRKCFAGRVRLGVAFAERPFQ